METKERVYIASPFFDDFSCAWVSAREEEMEGFKVDYFSPRQDGIKFNEEGINPRIRSERIREVFKNNVRELDKCTNLIANFHPCKGRVDIGTLWEVGYFVAKKPQSNITIYGGGDWRLKKFVYNLGTQKEKLHTPGKSVILKVPENCNTEKIRRTITLLNYDWNLQPQGPSDLEVYPESDYIICTDGFDPFIAIFMGYLYGNKIPYSTVSFENYGSNIMIAASSQGHIQLPAFQDFTLNKDLI